MRKRLQYRLKPPVTLSEKVKYKMAFDRRPILTTFADKWEVREYVAEKVGTHVLNEVYFLITEPGEVDVSSLPERCVIKPTHGSASVIVVDERASPNTLPELDMASDWLYFKCRIRREDLDQKRLRQIVGHWLNAAYPMTNEWAYHNITPRVIVEQYIEGKGMATPTDYKHFVMHGKVVFIEVDIARFEGQRRQLFYPTWEPVPVAYRFQRPETLPEKPECLAEMLEIASTLGSETDFVRVDLYEENGHIRFGELTNYPAAGKGSFSDARFETTLAESWVVPRKYR